MSSYWKVPAVAIAFLAWLTAPPIGLADASRREALRRQLTPKATRSLSNLDLPAAPPEVVSVQGTAVAGEANLGGEQGVKPPVTATVSEEAPPPTGDKPVTEAGEVKKGEQWWRDHLAKARAAVVTDQQKAIDLQNKIDLLTTQAVNRDDPAQQAKLWVDRQVALKDLEAVKAQIITDQQAILDIQAEARRQGVPPGWIR